MSALAALALGVLGVAYAAWPAWRRPVGPLESGPSAAVTPAEIESDATALRAWSQAAGELSAAGGGSEGSGAAPLDPEEVPK